MLAQLVSGVFKAGKGTVGRSWQCFTALNYYINKHASTTSCRETATQALQREPVKTNHRKLIKQITEVTSSELVPEIQLHLITPSCNLWYSKPEDCPFQDPFWAFFWPGGQVLTRFILDHPKIVKGKAVLDIGSGCGASAIAAHLAGASTVVANDIDEVAAQAICMNAELNKCQIKISTENMVGSQCRDFDVILLGDMFYDENSKYFQSWLLQLKLRERQVFVGDPGRHYLQKMPIDKLIMIAKYTLPQSLVTENSGLTEGYVFELL